MPTPIEELTHYFTTTPFHPKVTCIDRTTWDGAVGDPTGTHCYGYIATADEIFVCPELIVDQAGSFIGTDREARLLTDVPDNAAMRNAIGIYAGTIHLLLVHEAVAAASGVTDPLERRLLAEGIVYDIVPDDLAFVKQVQARVAIRSGR